MALFEAYAKPGVYVQESTQDAGITLFGTPRVPVIIGEGEEFRNVVGKGLHRGSSTFFDEQVVRENLTAQVDGLTRKFKVGYTPVVVGDGRGSLTNAPQDIKVYANDLPILVSSLNGKTGEFTTQSILEKGTDLRVDYFFKRSDTEVLNESLSEQVPLFATAKWTTDQTTNMTATLTTPGALGNLVALTLAPHEYRLSTPLVDIVFFETGNGNSEVPGTPWTPTPQPKVTITAGSVNSATFGSGTLSIVYKASDKLITFFADPSIVASVGPLKAVNITPRPGVDIKTASFTDLAPTNAEIITYRDDQSVTGLGTDSITVHLTKPDRAFRSFSDIVTLLNAGSFTASCGNIVASGGTGVFSAGNPVKTQFTGGAGPATNKTFKVINTPMVDGSNGGVVTTNPADVRVTVNGAPVKVASVNGLYGTFTLVNAVPEGSDLRASYFFNTYQDTFDVLPGDNITSLTEVGYGPGRSDFIEGVDFVLEKTLSGESRIQWGASTSVHEGLTKDTTAPFTMPITPTIVDEYVYLRPVTGLVDGVNSQFSLEDAPTVDYRLTDGSQRSKVTDDPSKVRVFAGSDPIDALSRPPLRVVSLNGANRTFTLYNPPAKGQKLFASYHRSTLNDHVMTLEVTTPGVTGQGTYKITNEFGQIVPKVKEDSRNVSDSQFSNTGIVWPYAFSDLRTQVGATAPTETITIKFEDDGQQFIVVNPVQAFVDLQGLKFFATIPGKAPNTKTAIKFVAGTATPDATAITKTAAEEITVQLLDGTGKTRTVQEIRRLFETPVDVALITTVLSGRINITEGTGYNPTTAAQVATLTLDKGVDGEVVHYATRYTVTSNRTPEDSKKDGYGITEGTGYLNQTFIARTSGVQFTMVDPHIDPLAHPEYGYTSTPSPTYYFTPGDTLTFSVDSLPRTTSAIPVIDVPGVRLKVTSTYGMGVGNTGLLNLYNKSGAEPRVGDSYYVSYKVAKTAKDFQLKLFSNVQDIYAEYGQPNATNKLSLAAKLFNLNGGGLVGCVQVPKQLGMETASDQTYMEAIASLARPLPGSESKASVIIPMTTSAPVIQVLNRHLITQQGQRMGGEAIAYVGFGLTDSVNDARRVARSLKSDRMIAIFPGGAILTMDVNGRAVEFAVGGEFLAAAMAGLDLSPAYDVATSLTRKNLVGFDRLIERYDDNIMDLAAADGLTFLVEMGGGLQIRHYITTDNTSPLKREPTNRKVADTTRARLRRNLDQFIARKVLSSLLADISIVVHSTMKGLIGEELVAGYKDVVIQPDPADDTVVHVSLKFKPISSLIWLDVNLSVTQRL